MILDANSPAMQIAIKYGVTYVIISGTEIPRYANTKFSQMYPKVSTRYSIQILPQGLKEWYA